MQSIRSLSYAYTIDSSDVIMSVSPSWHVFARSNHAETLTPEYVIGKPLWQFVASTKVRDAYSRVVERVRRHNTSAAIPFQCDSPGCRRYMRLTIDRAGENVRFSTKLIRSRPRPHFEAMEMEVQRSSRVVPMCSVCLRLQGNDSRWRQPEDTVIRLGLVSAVAPILDPTLCDLCESMIDQCAMP